MKKKRITLEFGALGRCDVMAIPVSTRMAVHQACSSKGVKYPHFIVSDPVTGYSWGYRFENEADALAWANKFVAALGDDPLPDGVVSGHANDDWVKPPARKQEIKAWLKANRPPYF